MNSHITVAVIFFLAGLILGMIVRNKAVKEARALAASAGAAVRAARSRIDNFEAEKAAAIAQAKQNLINEAKKLTGSAAGDPPPPAPQTGG